VGDGQIEQPIWTCIATRRMHDRILYIVLTKDVPIRLIGTSERNGTRSSVDSELTLLYRRRAFMPRSTVSPKAAAALCAAVKADPTLVNRDEVQKLRRLIAGGSQGPR
jgi:hypothetical protein